MFHCDSVSHVIFFQCICGNKFITGYCRSPAKQEKAPRTPRKDFKILFQKNKISTLHLNMGGTSGSAEKAQAVAQAAAEAQRKRSGSAAEAQRKRSGSAAEAQRKRSGSAAEAQRKRSGSAAEAQRKRSGSAIN
jgi:hypothetical protein